MCERPAHPPGDEDAFGNELLGGDPDAVPALLEAARAGPMAASNERLKWAHKDDTARRIHVHLLAPPLHALVVPAKQPFASSACSNAHAGTDVPIARSGEWRKSTSCL